jgi:hypothetical protein
MFLNRAGISCDGIARGSRKEWTASIVDGATGKADGDRTGERTGRIFGNVTGDRGAAER